MFAPINPGSEYLRAQNVLRSFTEYEHAVDLFVLLSPRPETAKPTARAGSNTSRFIMQFFKVINPRNLVPLGGLTESQAGREPF